MPFKSKKQAKWMFANKPKMAKEWASKTDWNSLPSVAKEVKKRMRRKHGKEKKR